MSASNFYAQNSQISRTYINGIGEKQPAILFKQADYTSVQ